MDSWIFVCVNRRKEIVSVQNQQGRVDNDTLLGSLQVASDVSTELFQLIDTVIEVGLFRVFDGVEGRHEVDFQHPSHKAWTIRLVWQTLFPFRHTNR